MNKKCGQIIFSILFLVVAFSLDSVFAQDASLDDFDKSLKRFHIEHSELKKIQSEKQLNQQKEQSSRLLEQSKEVLTRSIEVLLARTVQLKKRVDGQKAFYEKYLSDIHSILLTERDVLQTFYRRAQEATTLQDVKNVAQDVKTYRSEHADDVGELVLFAHLDHFETVVLEQALNRIDRIEARLVLLEKDGRDISGFKNLISQAQEHINRSQNNVVGIRKDITVHTLSRLDKSDIQKKLEQAERFVKDAYAVFRTIAVRGGALFESFEKSGATTSTE